jgi:LysM repeat protein
VSSIRPLATITLLALVGVFLYMKINETEPQLPADIADWTMPAELDISQSPSVPSFAESSSAAASADSSSAPAFAPTTPQTSTVPAFSATPPTITAPSFSSSPPALQPQTAAADGSSTKAADVPSLPEVPVAGATASPATAEASPPFGDVPSVEVSAPDLQAASVPQPQPSLFSTTRLAVQAALDRGELSQALLLLSDWYGDPSLSPAETQEVDLLLSQLAGSVIYSIEHRLEPPYMVQAGEGLQEIAQRFEVPWQLLAKINGLSSPDGLQPGQQLKVVRGPFSALVDLSQRRLTLMLDRRYAGQFAIEVEPTTSEEEGHWSVNQKLITPGNVGQMGSAPTTPTDQKSIMMTNTSDGASQIAILRGANGSAPGSTDPAGRVIRLKIQDVGDVYDILSLGSQVVIRR